LIDYKKIAITLNQVIKKNTGNITIVQTNQTDEQPDYPFASYGIISPYIPITSARVGDTTTEVVEMVFSYTFVALDAFDAMALSQKAASAFKLTATLQTLSDQNIAFVSILGTGSRDNFITIETERRYGFDIRVRVKHSDSAESDYFDKVIT